jgi:hypothetical protein
MNNKFKVIAMGRVGTLAINRFLNNHPHLSVPAYGKATKTFKSPTESIGDMLVDRSGQSLHKGMVIHDAAFFDKQYRKRMTILNNIKVDAIVHLVRNPYEQAKGWINHINASACMGALGWQKIPSSAEGFYTNYPLHFKTMQPGLQCRTFYKNYTKVKVIDFPSLNSAKIEQTMHDVYHFLGEDKTHQNNMLHVTQNNYTRELLLQGINFKLNNEIVEMGMTPVDLFFHKDKNAKPWVTIHDTQSIYALCPTLPALKGDLLFMPKSVDAFNKLALKTRKMVSQGITDILAEVLPVWAKNAEQTAQQIEQTKLHTLSDEDRAFITKTMRDDLDIFTRYHPEFKSLWDL